MLLKSINKSKIKKVIHLGNLYYFLPLIIISSSFKFFGYGLSFIFFIPFVIKKSKIIQNMNMTWNKYENNMQGHMKIICRQSEMWK